MEKSKIMMIIIIVLLVVLLGTVGAVSFFVLNLINNQTAPAEDGPPGVTTVKDLDMSQKSSVPLGDEITTNLVAGADGTVHIARMMVNLVYDNSIKGDSEDFRALLDANIAIARSIALRCISSHTYEEIDPPDKRLVLADEIKTLLQDEFNTTIIVDVVFDDWLIP